MAERRDVTMDQGAKLVLLTEGDEAFYARLLVPKNGVMTFITPKCPLSVEDCVMLMEAVPPCSAVLGDLKIEVQPGEDGVWTGDFIASANGFTARGSHVGLRYAINRM